MGFVFRFFLLVLFLSSAELYLLIMVAARFSFVTAFALCALTGIVGGAVVRKQGLQTLIDIRDSLSRGVFPPIEIISGLMLIVLGALLMVPGFITDTIGMILLIPSVRLGVARRVLSGITEAIRSNMTSDGGGLVFRWFTGGLGGSFSGGGGDNFSSIDGLFENRGSANQAQAPEDLENGRVIDVTPGHDTDTSGNDPHPNR